MTVMPYTPQLADCCSSTTTEFGDTLYVMLEWFGAAADGVTDDSDAFIRALADGRPIGLAANKSYALKNITITPDMVCPGVFSLGGQARIVPPPAYLKDDSTFFIHKTDEFFVENIFFDMPTNTNPLGTWAYRGAIRLEPAGLRGGNYRVEKCKFSGGLAAIIGIGYIIENSQFVGNFVTGTYSDGFSFNAVINVDITDNIFDDGGYGDPSMTGSPSGAIRTGTHTQLDTSVNVNIARNTITRYCIGQGQSAIDCFSGAARSIRITDNICAYNGAGIELKTQIWIEPSPPPPGASDVYEDNVVANNTIRLFSDRSTSGITVFHANPGAPKGKAANVKVSGNIVSSTNDVPPGVYSHYAISVEGHDNVMIDSNQIFNVDHGIAVGGRGPVGDTADNITISNNMVDVVGIAIQQSSGTVNHLYIANNPLLRVGATAISPAVYIGDLGTDIEISGNRIENLATGVQALEIRGVTNARITDNTIIANGTAVVNQTTAVTNVKFRDNEVISATSYAFSLGAGTAIEVSDNTVEVPLAFAVVSGAASYTAAGNVRGLLAANPTGTAAGSLGDIYLDSTAATAGWRCTAAGNIGGATYTVI